MWRVKRWELDSVPVLINVPDYISESRQLDLSTCWIVITSRLDKCNLTRTLSICWSSHIVIHVLASDTEGQLLIITRHVISVSDMHTVCF